MKKSMIAVFSLLILAVFAMPVLAGGQGDCGDKVAEKKAPASFDKPQEAGTKATCPVTGQTFTISEDSLHSEHNGEHVYFCCPACKPQYDKDPEKFNGENQS